MFLARRPSRLAIERFLRNSGELPLSYAPTGMLSDDTLRDRFDQQVVTIGHGQDDFERARNALADWKHFNIGWIETFPRPAPLHVGTVVAVQIRHLGFWSLNGCRIVYHVGNPEAESRFGFAYGTLTNHAEAGEELFEVRLDRSTNEVSYTIRAISWPRATLARIGQPLVRVLQARFRRDSAAAMLRAVRGV